MPRQTLNEMKHIAESDYLTGLANRRGLNEYIASCDDTDIIHAMFIDIDNFKRVNDIYGHSMGDRLLIEIGNLIKKNADGFCSRIGGDEFVVIFDGKIPGDELEKIAENMLADMPKIGFRRDILSLVSLSIGIVLDQPAFQPIDDILYKCDSAMYKAKYNGKNQYVVYHSYDEASELNRNIELEMDEALKNGDFKVYYQPKVNMVTTELYGAEALSRWPHPVDGLRVPSMYIPIFEKNGFISKLDFYVFEEVCKHKASWKGEKYEHSPISVNISRLHLYDVDFPDKLEKIAGKYKIPCNELELEITENVFIKDSKELIKMVDLLQKKGFVVSIDDFGSGYSALNLLKDIPVNTIKIDKEFLQVSSNNSRGKTVLKDIIGLCRDLKLDVVTEGIETKDQADFIISCGCQIAQGFFYSKPVDEPSFRKFADEYLTNPMDHFSFRFDGSLLSDDGEYEASIEGEGVEYDAGIYSDSKSLFFPGGLTGKNLVKLPEKVLVNDSYTISMWIKPKENHLWASAMYVKFESGFASILPIALEGTSDFRIRDSREVNGWYDIGACQLREGEWAQYSVTYNAKTEVATAFINGEVVGILENVPPNRYVKMIMVGGDVFQPSFVGNIAEIMIYNEAKDHKFIADLHQQYVLNSKFTAIKFD